MSSSMFYFIGDKMKQKELYKTVIYCRLSLDAVSYTHLKHLQEVIRQFLSINQ